MFFLQRHPRREDFRLADRLGAVINLDDFSPHRLSAGGPPAASRRTVCCRFNPGGHLRGGGTPPRASRSWTPPATPSTASPGRNSSRGFRKLKAMGARRFGLHALLGLQHPVQRLLPRPGRASCSSWQWRLEREDRVRRVLHRPVRRGGHPLPARPARQRHRRHRGRGCGSSLKKSWCRRAWGTWPCAPSWGRFVLGPNGCLVTPRPPPEAHLQGLRGGWTPAPPT